MVIVSHTGVSVNSDQSLNTTTDVFHRIFMTMQKNLLRCADYDGTFFTAGNISRKASRITKAFSASLTTHFGAQVAQELNCACCKNTLHHIGSLRIITEDNLPQAVFWDPELADEDLKGFFSDMKSFCESEKTRGPLFSDVARINKVLNTATYGTNHSGGFNHFCFSIPTRNTIPSTDVVRFTREFREGHKQIMLTLKDKHLTTDSLVKTIAVLISADCDRAEFANKVNLQGWIDLLTSALTTGRYDNAAWRVQGTGYNPSFWSMRSSVVWKLLSDISSGKKPVDRAMKNFRAMTHSTRYQRATTAPSQVSIDQAEALVKELNLKDALKRRQVTMEDLLPFAIWVAPEDVAEKEEVSDAGVFSHLKSKTAPRPTRAASTDYDLLVNSSIPPTNMSWRKFSEEILPTIKDLWVKITEQKAPFFSFMTEEIPGSEPILVWDKPYARCPISWYTYSSPIPVNALDLTIGSIVHIDAIVPNMSIRNDLKEEDRRLIGGVSVPFFVTKTVNDIIHPSAGVRLFPEILRTDIKNNVGLRRVFEAYSASAKPGLPEGYVGSLRPFNPDPTKADNSTLTILASTEKGPRWIRISHLD